MKAGGRKSLSASIPMLSQKDSLVLPGLYALNPPLRRANGTPRLPEACLVSEDGGPRHNHPARVTWDGGECS